MTSLGTILPAPPDKCFRPGQKRGRTENDVARERSSAGPPAAGSRWLLGPKGWFRGLEHRWAAVTPQTSPGPDCWVWADGTRPGLAGTAQDRARPLGGRRGNGTQSHPSVQRGRGLLPEGAASHRPSTDRPRLCARAACVIAAPTGPAAEYP